MTRPINLQTESNLSSDTAHYLAHDQLAAGDLPLAASAVRAFNLHLHYEIRGREAGRRPQSPPAERHA